MQVKDGKDGKKMRGADVHCTTRQAFVQRRSGDTISPAQKTDIRAPENLLVVATFLVVTPLMLVYPCRRYHKR